MVAPYCHLEYLTVFLFSSHIITFIQIPACTDIYKWSFFHLPSVIIIAFLLSSRSLELIARSEIFKHMTDLVSN